MISRIIAATRAHATWQQHPGKSMSTLSSYLPKDTADYLDYPQPIPSFPLKKSPLDELLQKHVSSLLSLQSSTPLTKELMQHRYTLLKGEKWREYIDGKDASYGKHCYDMGTHQGGLGEREPGYLTGMINATAYICDSIDQSLTIQNYLKIHSLACEHFKNERADDFTICRKEEVGEFRTIRVGALISPSRKLSDEVVWQAHQLDRRIGSSYFEKKKDLHIALSYRENQNTEQMSEKFQKLLYGYQRDIERCEDNSQKLYVIARLYQHSQWLHTTTDGSGRLDIAVLNKHLTQNGFHPAILFHPYMCCTSTLAEWIEKLQDGLYQWQETALKVHGFIRDF